MLTDSFQSGGRIFQVLWQVSDGVNSRMVMTQTRANEDQGLCLTVGRPYLRDGVRI